MEGIPTKKTGPSFQAPRGTVDILPDEQPYWRYVHNNAENLAELFGYQRMDTPVFENSQLFVRSIGEITDIVQKEMYKFEDLGGDFLTLRPEGTASICRAYLEHGMHNLPQPVRLYYFCPIFRYERPQAGRLRQHNQFGLEAIGDEDPSVDAEVIEIGWRLLEQLGLTNLSLLINSIGDQECRPNYLSNLKKYYMGKIKVICNECKNRLERNPMRLLDCKNSGCQETIAQAPHNIDYLCTSCKSHWEQFLSYLKLLKLPYIIDHRLVRGFDYYTRTVFEIQPPFEGAMSTIMGGGRYDGLINELGGNPTPAIGFGSGIERIILNLQRQNIVIPANEKIQAVVAYIGEDAKERALIIASQLRQNGNKVITAPANRSLKSQMRYASSFSSPYVIIIGEQELRSGNVILRDMVSGNQKEIPADSINACIRASIPAKVK